MYAAAQASIVAQVRSRCARLAALRGEQSHLNSSPVKQLAGSQGTAHRHERRRRVTPRRLTIRVTGRIWRRRTKAYLEVFTRVATVKATGDVTWPDAARGASAGARVAEVIFWACRRA